MAGSLTNYGEAAALTALFLSGNTWLGLLSGNPAETGDASTEVSGNAYTRKQITWSAVTGAAPSTLTNTTQLLFPSSTGAWRSGAALAYFGIFDAASGGNMLAYGDLSPAQTVSASAQTVLVDVGQLSVTCDLRTGSSERSSACLQQEM